MTKNGLTGSRRKTLEAVITYLENNREHMTNTSRQVSRSAAVSSKAPVATWSKTGWSSPG
jgi:hypothetical protein